MPENGSNFVPKLHKYPKAPKIRPIEDPLIISEEKIESKVNIRQQKIDPIDLSD